MGASRTEVALFPLDLQSSLGFRICYGMILQVQDFEPVAVLLNKVVVKQPYHERK